MAPKKTVAKKEEDGSNSNNKASSGSGGANSNKSAADRVIAVTAAEGYTGSALLELLASDQFKGSYSKLVGLTFGEPKDDVKAILEDAGIETMMVDEIDEKMIKQLGVDTLCLIPPANKVRRVFIRIRLSGRWRFSACHGALIAVSSPDRTGENGPRQADPHPRKEGQVGPERRTRLFGRCRLRRARQAATPPRVYRPRGTDPVSAVTWFRNCFGAGRSREASSLMRPSSTGPCYAAQVGPVDRRHGSLAVHRPVRRLRPLPFLGRHPC